MVLMDLMLPVTYVMQLQVQLNLHHVLVLVMLIHVKQDIMLQLVMDVLDVQLTD